MDEAEVDAYCMSFSGVQEQHSFGGEFLCWSVDGRIFAMMAKGSAQVSLRCPDEKIAETLINHGRAGKLPHLPHGGWIAVDLALDDFALKSRLRDSYEMVRSGRI